MKDDIDTEDEDYEDETDYAGELFAVWDYGPESHRIINGKVCVYLMDGIWISKDGIELDER